MIKFKHILSTPKTVKNQVFPYTNIQNTAYKNKLCLKMNDCTFMAPQYLSSLSRLFFFLIFSFPAKSTLKSNACSIYQKNTIIEREVS